MIPPDVWQGYVALAAWPFRFAPSEIDALPFQDFRKWIEEAERFRAEIETR